MTTKANQTPSPFETSVIALDQRLRTLSDQSSRTIGEASEPEFNDWFANVNIWVDDLAAVEQALIEKGFSVPENNWAIAGSMERLAFLNAWAAVLPKLVAMLGQAQEGAPYNFGS